jgi:ketosteroid isomerase-like protein
MPGDDVRFVCEMYEALNRGETQKVLELLHPDAELHQDPSQPDSDSYYGREEFIRGYGRFINAWEEFRYDVEAAEQVGDCVLLSLRLWGRGRGSGAETTTSMFHAWTLRDGKAHRCFVRTTRAAALQAAGPESID